MDDSPDQVIKNLKESERQARREQRKRQIELKAAKNRRKTAGQTGKAVGGATGGAAGFAGGATVGAAGGAVVGAGVGLLGGGPVGVVPGAMQGAMTGGRVGKATGKKTGQVVGKQAAQAPFIPLVHKRKQQLKNAQTRERQAKVARGQIEETMPRGRLPRKSFYRLLRLSIKVIGVIGAPLWLLALIIIPFSLMIFGLFAILLIAAEMI